MSDRGTESDAREVRKARRHLFEDVLGEEWIAQGDGTYRFLDADAPLARDDSYDDAKRDPLDEATAREHWLPGTSRQP